MVLGRDSGEWVMRVFGNSEGNLYTFHSAKKIYFVPTPSKYLLIEKKTGPRALNLVSRKTAIFSNGIPVFQK